LSLFHIDAGREWRGGQRQAFFLAGEIQKKGYPFKLVVQPDSPLQAKAVEAGLPVLPIAMKSEADFWAVHRLARAMRRERCVLAHFHDAHGAAIGARAAARAHVPIRIVSRRVDFPIRSRRKYIKAIDAVIAISEGVREVLVKGGVPERLISVVPSGIDFAPFREIKARDFLRKEFGFGPEDYLVGIVAQLEDHKGHRDLIEAARILKDHAPRVRIVIVGEGSLRMQLDRQAHELRVEDVVYFLGFREDVPRILASLDLFVLSSRMEGLGSSIMDAMASRLPVVATQAGGIPEVVIHRETGLLVPPQDPPALANAILKLYLDKALAGRLAQRGFEVVHERFSAEAMAMKIIGIYERIASEKGVRLGGPSPHP
jgi:glycosyltransferase involved in cell wall biosynthesis